VANDAPIHTIEAARGLSPSQEHQFCERLIGAEQLWLQACQQAVAQLRIDWLEQFRSFRPALAA
jgi:hypothetical protein